MSIRAKLFKLALIGLCGAMAVFYCFHAKPALADSSGPPASRTGAPGELTCNAAGCHSGNSLNEASGSLKITGLPADGYAPGQEITLTVTLSRSGSSRYGFELTAVDEQGRRAGELVVTESSRTQLITGAVNGNTRQYIEHRSAGIIPNGTNQNSWTLKWRAPAENVGTVTFYAAGNAANGNGANTGDFIYTTSASVQPASSAPSAVAAVSAASFAQGALASEAIAALYGTGLANETSVASIIPLPTELSGVTVRVKDAGATERDSPLFFVSGGQINFLVPSGVTNGGATVTVLRDGGAVGAGAINIESVAPGFFAANADGQGVPAAVVLRVKGDGTQTFEPVAQFNQTTSRFEPIEIDLGPETDQLFLIAYGTGFRYRSALSAVSVIIGGANAEVFFAGEQGALAGLDQANIRIPRGLAGRGDVNLVMIVDGKTANTMQIRIR